MDSEEKYKAAMAMTNEGNPDFDLKKAVELLQEVIRTEPEHQLARHFLADGLRRLGCHESRLEVLLKGFMRDEDTFQRIQIAACLFDLGRYEEGLSWVENEDLNPAVFSLIGLTVRARLYRALGLADHANADQKTLDEFESAQPFLWDELD